MFSIFRTLTVFATLLVLSISIAIRAEEKPVYLFVLTGQSNMVGMKPEEGFMQEAQKLFPDGEVVYVKVAVGGQPIRLWVSNWGEIATKNGIDTQKFEKEKDGFGKYYKQILEQVSTKLNGRTPKAVTFCWMQGERDAREKLDAAYTETLKTLIANLRKDLKAPEMNSVIARISDCGKPDDKSWQAIREVQVAVANSDPHGAWVDCDDLNDKMKDGKKYDDLHYTPEGYKMLGERYARQAKALVDGRKPADNGRP